MKDKPKPGTDTSTPGEPILFPNIKQFFYFAVSALALIALAGYMGKAAIVFTLILIAGVLLTHWKDYAGYLNPPK